jgi:hypothetical protein
MHGDDYGWQFIVGRKPTARIFMVRIGDFATAQAEALRTAGSGEVESYAMILDELLAELGLQAGAAVEFEPENQAGLIDRDGYHRRRSTNA